MAEKRSRASVYERDLLSGVKNMIFKDSAVIRSQHSSPEGSFL